MSRPLTGLAVTLSLACAVPVTAEASTASGPREALTFTWSSTKPGTANGVSFSARYRDPSNPGGRPPALRRVVVTNPTGTRIDSAVVPRCQASDAQLEMSGDAACPSGSKIGSGVVNTLVGGIVPFQSDLSIFNTRGGQLQLVKFGNGGSVVVHTAIRGGGRTLDTLVPTCVTGGQPPTGCPADQTYVVSSRQDGPARTVHGRAYFRTPTSCPRSHRWLVKTAFHYAGGAVDTLTTPQRCTPPARRKRRHHGTRKHGRTCHGRDDERCETRSR